MAWASRTPFFIRTRRPSTTWASAVSPVRRTCRASRPSKVGMQPQASEPQISRRCWRPPWRRALSSCEALHVHQVEAAASDLLSFVLFLDGTASCGNLSELLQLSLRYLTCGNWSELLQFSPRHQANWSESSGSFAVRF